MNDRHATQIWAEVLSISISDAEHCSQYLDRDSIAVSHPLFQPGMDAIEWIFFSDLEDRSMGTFGFVCDLLDVDPVVVRRKLAARQSIQVAGKFYRHYVLGIVTKGVVNCRIRKQFARAAA